MNNYVRFQDAIKKCGYKVNENIASHSNLEAVKELERKLAESNVYFEKKSESEILITEAGIDTLEGDSDTISMYFEKQAESLLQHIRKEIFERFILDEQQEPKLIDHALGFVDYNGNKLRYVGAMVYENVKTTDKKGNSTIHRKKNNVIVTENKLMLSTNSTNVDFSFCSELGLKKNRWSIDSIKEYINGKYDYITFEEVFKVFRKQFSDSMVYEFEEWYDLLALWCLTTYFQDICNKSLIIKVEGASGVAKSKTGANVCNLAFNGKKFLCPTPANFFRYRHNNKATLFIEEAERLFDDSKKNQSGDSELVEYINGSYEKGNTVPRQNDKNINQTDEFDPYGWTMIGSIKALKGALQKRSITLYQIKAKKSDKRGDVEISPDDPAFSIARNKAYALSLLKYRDFQEKYNSLKERFGLANREFLVAKPIIALAYCVSDELGQKTGLFIADRFKIREDGVNKDSWEFSLIESLLELTLSSSKYEFIAVETIKERFLQKLGDQYSKVSLKKITGMIKELGFADYKSVNSKGTKRGFTLDFWKVCEILLRNDKLTIQYIQEKVKEVSNTSKSNISPIQLDEWFSDTFSDTYTFTPKVSDSLTDMTDNTEVGGVFFDSKTEPIHNRLLSHFGNKKFHTKDLEAYFSIEEIVQIAKLKENGDLLEIEPEIFKLNI